MTTTFAFTGEYVAQPEPEDAEALVTSALIASVIPVNPPKSWFENPHLTAPTAITVDDTGRVFGHCAAWNVSHIGLPFSTKPPRSRTNYAYFHTGVLRCAEGNDVAVGQLTLSGGHANLELSANDAIKHYDDTHSAVADVHVGEDAHGIWVAGALRPGVTPEQIRALRASAPSGDWRPINGRLELVAVLQVNVPGFPVTRARVASGYITALVAAGAATIAEARGPSIADRLERIERALLPPVTAAAEPDPELAAKVAALSARVHTTPEQQAEAQALAASVRLRMQALTDEDDEVKVFKDVSTEKRKELAKKGHALPDGSFPIVSAADISRAVRAYGRANKEDRAKVRRHIMRRARGLGRADLIPESWKSASVEERHVDMAATFRALRHAPAQIVHDELVARVAALKFDKTRFEPELHPRDDVGKFRDVLARLSKSVADTPEGAAAQREIEAAEKANDNDQKLETERHINELLKIVGRVEQGNMDPNTAKTLREGYTALGRFVSGTPLPAGVDAEKMRYTDLAQPVQETIDDLLAKLQAYVDPDTFKEVTAPLMEFKRGGDVWNAGELMSSLSAILRYLLGTGNSEEQVKEDRDKKERETGSPV